MYFVSINRQLEKQDSMDGLGEKLEKLNPDGVSARAQDNQNSIKYILDVLPNKLNEAKQLYDDRHGKQKAIVEAGNFG